MSRWIHRWHRAVLLAAKGTEFVARLERFAREQDVDLVPFRKGQRKDEVTQNHLPPPEGAV